MALSHPGGADHGRDHDADARNERRTMGGGREPEREIHEKCIRASGDECEKRTAAIANAAQISGPAAAPTKRKATML